MSQYNLAALAKETEDCLLGWLSQYNPKNTSYSCFSQPYQDGLLLQILLCIDPSHFAKLAESQSQNTQSPLSYSEYLDAIDSYLQLFMGMLIKRKCRASMLQQESVCEMCTLILYLCVHCHNKLNFVQSILRLPAKDQGLMMSVIETGKSYVEDSQEVGELMDKVAQLQAQYDELAKQHEEQKEQTLKLNQENRQLKEEIQMLEEECRGYRMEKCELMRELGLTNSSSNTYFDIFKQLQQENMELTDSLARLHDQLDRTIREGEQYKAKLKEDGLLISELSSEISRIKGENKTLRNSCILDNEKIKKLTKSLCLMELQSTPKNVLTQQKSYRNLHLAIPLQGCKAASSKKLISIQRCRRVVVSESQDDSEKENLGNLEQDKSETQSVDETEYLQVPRQTYQAHLQQIDKYRDCINKLQGEVKFYKDTVLQLRNLYKHHRRWLVDRDIINC